LVFSCVAIQVVFSLVAAVNLKRTQNVFWIGSTTMDAGGEEEVTVTATRHGTAYGKTDDFSFNIVKLSQGGNHYLANFRPPLAR